MLQFIFNSILCGTGLAMDAFSVSIVHGLEEPLMKRKTAVIIAGVFALFQFFMPVTGWFFIHTAASRFAAFQRLVPWIAFVLLLFLGIRMLLEARKKKDGQELMEEAAADSAGQVTRGWAAELAVQAVATSIDALSVGIIMASFDLVSAIAESVIIGLVTFIICLAGIRAGKAFGLKLAAKAASAASIVGGLILIFIGFKILLFP